MCSAKSVLWRGWRRPIHVRFVNEGLAMLDCFIQLRNRYTMDLVPLPFYEGEVTPGQIKKHSQVKEWIQRELDVFMDAMDHR